MYPTLLSIAGFHLSSFSIFFILAWCVFSFIFWKSLRNEGVVEERIFDLMFYGTLVALVGARAGFVLFHWNAFVDAPLKIIALWVAPGLFLMGALIPAVPAMMVIAKRTKVRVGIVFDAIGLALPGALAVGSVGSLLDGTVTGRVANVPWAIRYVGQPDFRHPYQLYEIVSLIVILVCVGWMTERARQKKWAMGSVGVAFFLLWSVATVGLEFFRDAGLYWYGVSVNQWAAFLLFFAAGGSWYRFCGGAFVVRGVVQTIYAKFPTRRS